MKMSRQPDPSESIHDVEEVYERFGISQNNRQFGFTEPPMSNEYQAFDGEQNDYVVIYEHRLSHNTHISRR